MITNPSYNWSLVPLGQRRPPGHLTRQGGEHKNSSDREESTLFAANNNKIIVDILNVRPVTCSPT